MNYSLSSTRKIGGFIQKIITNLNNAPRIDGTAFGLDILKEWHTAFVAFHPSERELGSIVYKGFTETHSTGNTNTGSVADVSFTVMSTINGTPKVVTASVTNVTMADMANAMESVYANLTGYNINNVNNYLTSAIVTLHD